MYNRVTSFDDFLNINISYLEGNIQRTFYHYEPIYDMNTKDLLTLHNHRIFTYCGQSYMGPDEPVQQVPYLSCIIEKKQVPFIIDLLYKQKDLKWMLGGYNGTPKLMTNSPDLVKNRYFVLTHDEETVYTNLEYKLYKIYKETNELTKPMIEYLETQCCQFVIFGSKNTRENIETLLISLLE